MREKEPSASHACMCVSVSDTAPVGQAPPARTRPHAHTCPHDALPCPHQAGLSHVFDAVYGASAGAINSTFFLSGVSFSCGQTWAGGRGGSKRTVSDRTWGATRVLQCVALRWLEQAGRVHCWCHCCSLPPFLPSPVLLLPQHPPSRPTRGPRHLHRPPGPWQPLPQPAPLLEQDRLPCHGPGLPHR